MLFVLARQTESAKIFSIINEIDPAAFVSQSSVIGVYGEGFDKFKAKRKKTSMLQEQARKLGITTEPVDTNQTTTAKSELPKA